MTTDSKESSSGVYAKKAFLSGCVCAIVAAGLNPFDVVSNEKFVVYTLTLEYIISSCRLLRMY